MFLVAEAEAKVIAHSYKATRSFWTVDGVMHFGLQERLVYWLEVIWPIDASGGEAPPLTWSHGGRTYAFRNGDPTLGYENQLGTYRAIYEDEDVWADA